MRTKKLLSLTVAILIVALAYSSYNISLSEFKLTDKNFSYIAGMNWYHSADGLQKGFYIAKNETKPIIVYFWAVWCQYCAKFQASTLGDPQVKKILQEDYVLVAEDLDQDKDVASKYGVGYPPQVLFLDSNDNVLDRIAGAVDADTFLPVVTKVRDEIRPKNGSIQKN